LADTPKAHGHEGQAAESSVRPEKQILKGISYAPVPIKYQGALIGNDDFMSNNTAALWGSEGRGDLAIMSIMGANAVRLYGNDPTLDHTSFLDEAHKAKLQVIAGFSDYPYTQSPDNCLRTGNNCYMQIKAYYLMNLRKGFLSEGQGARRYHPALRTVILMNEPDLKFFPINEPKYFLKALLSAFDAVLDAEKEMDIHGPRPNFTATFSFGVCPGCSNFTKDPAIGQMIELRSAMKDPASVGYWPKNNLWKVYQERFVNSLNTANPAADVARMFLRLYDGNFQSTPVFIGEYHPPQVDQRKDLELMLDIARDPRTMLQGVSFFEFQVRYDKGGAEMDFGLFGLGSTNIAGMRIGGEWYTGWCLTPQRDPITSSLMPDDVAHVFGGHGIQYNELCSGAKPSELIRFK